MESDIEGIEDLPLEILETIISKMSLDEISRSVQEVSHKFRVVARNVMFANFKAIGPSIASQLNQAKQQLLELSSDMSLENLEREMILVAQYTFLQIMYHEYQVLCAIFLDHEFVAHSTLIFKISENLAEFRRLLDGSSLNQWDWRAGNVSTAMDPLRNLNSKIVDIFFWNEWDFKEAHFGPMTLKLLNCSLNSKYLVTVTHEAEVRYQDSKCHMFGHYEVADLSSTLVLPPGGLQEICPLKGIRLLAAYICNTVRWGNMFHTLRLRWVCMDRALAVGRRQRPGWPLLDAGNPYISPTSSLSSEVVQELRNGDRRIIRVLEKTSEDPQMPDWIGMKCEFQLWCPILQGPAELLGGNVLYRIKDLPPSSTGSNCTRPYLFKMEFKTYVRAIHAPNQGIVENTVWVEESAQSIKITQSKQTIK